MNISKESKAKKLIKEYLKTNMNDWDSYEPLEFSKLDSTFKFISSNEKYKHEIIKCLDVLDSIYDASNKEEQDNYDLYMEVIENRIQRDHAERIRNIGDKIDTMFIFNGWRITHKFRNKNMYGAKVIETKTFFFNKNITRITSIYDDE